MENKIHGAVEAAADASNAQKPPPPPAPPTVKGYEDSEGGNGQNGGNHIAKNEDDPPHWTRYVEVFCAIALVLITGTYTYYAGKQTHASIEAVTETRNAVQVARDTLTETQASNKQARIDAAKDSVANEKRAHDALQATIDQFIQDQRPWVSLTGFRVHLSPKAALIPNLDTTDEAVAEFQNSGHTPARDVHGVLGFGFKDRKHIMNFEDERWMAKQLDIQRRGFGGRKDWWLRLQSEGINSYRPWGKLVMGNVNLEPISLGVVGPGSIATYRRNEDWRAGTGITYDAFFFGELTYRDSSNTSHSTRFCVYRPENVGDIFDACPVFNGMD